MIAEVVRHTNFFVSNLSTSIGTAATEKHLIENKAEIYPAGRLSDADETSRLFISYSYEGERGLNMRFLFMASIVAIAALVASVAESQEGKLTAELNKLEEGEGGGCRAFFLFRNQTGMTLEGFEMSLAVLDQDGVIDRLLTIDAAPLPAARTTLKLFEIPEIGCGAISEFLVHDIASCRPQNAEETDCYAIMDLVSRASTRLVK